jgi:hypothetical protein
MIRRGIKQSSKSAVLAVAMAAAAMGYAYAADMPVKAPPVKAVPFFFVNDTSISFTYFPNSTDPGTPGGSGSVAGGVFGQSNTFARYSGSIDHFDVWEYGTNLFHIEFDQYGGQDPALGIPNAQGSREFFSFGYSTLGFNELTHSKTFSNWFFKDVSLFFGGEAGVQDNFLDEHTTKGDIGLQWSLNLPGVVNVSLAANKEYTRNNFDSCGPTTFGVGYAGPCLIGGPFSGDREFQMTWKLFTFISEPLTFLPDSWPVTFVNVMNVTGPKGTGISTANLAAACGITATCLADTETKVEVFEDARLSLDASKVFWGKPGIWDAYVGYRYWYNKFGVDHNAFLFSTLAPGTAIESTAYVGTTYHFK